jgi:hypothetical protein
MFVDCAGHWGFVELYFPVFHVGFLGKIQVRRTWRFFNNTLERAQYGLQEM